MRPFFRQCTGIAIALLVSVSMANAANNKGLKGRVNDYFFKKMAYDVVESYTDNTVVKTIENLRDNIEALDNAMQKFAVSRSTKDLQVVGKAMKGSFGQFHRSRIFRYGPSAHYDFDKQLATWPADKVFIENAIKEISEGKLKIDAQTLWKRYSSHRGLHAVKYLIYNNNGTLRNVAEISDAEVAYLKAVTEVLKVEAIDYLAAWLGTKNLSTVDQALLTKAGKRVRPSYANEFKKPGENNSRYYSISIPLQEIIGESMTVLEDMVALVEELPKYRNQENIHYWDSVTPFDDIINQLKGVESSVTGGLEGDRGVSYLDLLAKRDEQLSERIVIGMAYAIKRAELVKKMKDKPVEMQEKATKLLAEEVEKLTVMFMAATPLVAADAAVDPFAPYGSDI